MNHKSRPVKSNSDKKFKYLENEIQFFLQMKYSWDIQRLYHGKI